MSMPMKTRFRATILPLAACCALALMGACSDSTAPQSATSPSQIRAGLVPTRTDFGGYLGGGGRDSLPGGEGLLRVVPTSLPQTARPQGTP